MTKYLQMNGTSSDQIILPSISIDKIVYEYYFDSTKTTSTSWYMDDNVVKGHVGQSGATCTKQDGTVVNIGYNYANVVKDVRATFIDSYAITKMFGLISGNLYDVKIYKAGILVAHYDMSTGTVIDQSGNGNDATLNGGTWLDDGTGGTPTSTSYTASLTDSVSFADTFTRVFKGYKTLTDSISTTDTISKSITAVVVDTVGTGDQTSSTMGSGTQLNDSITLLDSISKQLKRSLSDSISTSETPNKDELLSFNDTISSQDTLNKATVFCQQFSDSLAFTDSITTYKGKAINLSDSISIIDSISKSLYKHVNDTVSTGDGKQKLSDKKLSDVINSSDIITTNESKSILLSDSIALSDAISKALSQIKLDSISTNDISTQQSHFNLQLFDVIVTTDTINIHLPNAPTLLGSIQLQGKRELNIYLTGTRQLDVKLKGVIQ